MSAVAPCIIWKRLGDASNGLLLTPTARDGVISDDRDGYTIETSAMTTDFGDPVVTFSEIVSQLHVGSLLGAPQIANREVTIRVRVTGGSWSGVTTGEADLVANKNAQASQLIYYPPDSDAAPCVIDVRGAAMSNETPDTDEKRVAHTFTVTLQCFPYVGSLQRVSQEATNNFNYPLVSQFLFDLAGSEPTQPTFAAVRLDSESWDSSTSAMLLYVHDGSVSSPSDDGGVTIAKLSGEDAVTQDGTASGTYTPIGSGSDHLVALFQASDFPHAWSGSATVIAKVGLSTGAGDAAISWTSYFTVNGVQVTQPDGGKSDPVTLTSDLDCRQFAVLTTNFRLPPSANAGFVIEIWSEDPNVILDEAWIFDNAGDLTFLLAAPDEEVSTTYAGIVFKSPSVEDPTQSIKVNPRDTFDADYISSNGGSVMTALPPYIAETFADVTKSAIALALRGNQLAGEGCIAFVLWPGHGPVFPPADPSDCKLYLSYVPRWHSYAGS